MLASQTGDSLSYCGKTTKTLSTAAKETTLLHTEIRFSLYRVSAFPVYLNNNQKSSLVSCCFLLNTTHVLSREDYSGVKHYRQWWISLGEKAELPTVYRQCWRNVGPRSVQHSLSGAEGLSRRSSMGISSLFLTIRAERTVTTFRALPSMVTSNTTRTGGNEENWKIFQSIKKLR